MKAYQMVKQLSAPHTGLQQSREINNLCQKLCQIHSAQSQRVALSSYNKITIGIEFAALLSIFLALAAASWAGCALIDQCYEINAGAKLQ